MIRIVKTSTSRATILLTLAFALVSSAKAAPINFAPTGGTTTLGGYNPGTIQNVVSFGLGAGDAIAKNSISNGGVIGVGSTFQLYYQTTITSFVTTNNGTVNPVGLNAANGYQLTEVTTFNETVMSISNNAVTFVLTPGGPNSMKIYYEDLAAPGAIKADATTGNGYNVGTVIMSLNSTSDTSNYTDTTKTGANPGTPALNGAGYGDFVGVTTNNGIGGVSLGLSVGSGYNSSFFQTAGIVSSLFSSSIKNPFTEIAPSTGFNDPFTPPGTPPTIGASPGANNGTSGPDFLLQISGASQSFAVPEPASIAMTVLGLGGFAFGSYATRRRAKA